MVDTMSDETAQTWTPKKRRALKWEKAFIASLCMYGVVSKACDDADVNRSAVYAHREAHEDFAQAWAEALEIAADAMELEVRRRAVDGVEEPVYQGGGKVGTIRRYSDTLLMFLLKGTRPEKFRERHELVGKNGQELFKVYLATSEFNPDDA